MESSRLRAEFLIRSILGLADAALRAAHVATIARSWPIAELARALDGVCESAEQADARSREALIAIVDGLGTDGCKPIVRRLREQAAAESLLALERLVRQPPPLHPTGSSSTKAHVEAGASGRPLTLGERKSLARRPDRDLIQRLLADPHPDVVSRCLRNPRTTEDDVVRLAAKRPGRAEALAEIARSGWAHRPRVRIAIVMNPATPPEIAAPLTGLLLRPELELVARSPGVAPGVRGLCREHLERRPPFAARRGGGLH